LTISISKVKKISGLAADVDGLDDATKTLNKMAYGLTVEGVNQQLERSSKLLGVVA